MKLKKRESNGITIVDIDGRMVGGEDSDAMHAYIKELLGGGARKILINLSKVPWADSRGVGMLIGAHTSIENVGGKLVLTNIGDRIDSILTLTRLLLIFKTFDTEKEGIEYLHSV